MRIRTTPEIVNAVQSTAALDANERYGNKPDAFWGRSSTRCRLDVFILQGSLRGGTSDIFIRVISKTWVVCGAFQPATPGVGWKLKEDGERGLPLQMSGVKVDFPSGGASRRHPAGF